MCSGKQKKYTDRKVRQQSGYTLIELLVVLVILGGIIAIAAPQVFKYLDSAKADTVKIQISRLSGVLDLYRLDVGRYPNATEGLGALIETPQSSDGWNGPYLKKDDALTDPWGNKYEYRIPGTHGEFDIYSLGADGREGGDGINADLGSW